jgi:hypothetical protein
MLRRIAGWVVLFLIVMLLSAVALESPWFSIHYRTYSTYLEVPRGACCLEVLSPHGAIATRIDERPSHPWNLIAFGESTLRDVSSIPVANKTVWRGGAVLYSAMMNECLGDADTERPRFTEEDDSFAAIVTCKDGSRRFMVGALGGAPGHRFFVVQITSAGPSAVRTDQSAPEIEGVEIEPLPTGSAP